jgi:hypothetical protein
VPEGTVAMGGRELSHFRCRWVLVMWIVWDILGERVGRWLEGERERERKDGLSTQTSLSLICFEIGRCMKIRCREDDVEGFLFGIATREWGRLPARVVREQM